MSDSIPSNAQPSDGRGSQDQERGAARESAARESAAPRPAVDTSHVTAAYANFCRVTGTPEEVILDFGLNDQPFGDSERPVPITQRLVVNFFTAKRMLSALAMTVQRHEKAFGPVETDIRRRVVPNA